MNYLDKLTKCYPVTREFYGYDSEHKPNNYCNWERVLPTISSDFGWVENDEHLRNRIKTGLNNDQR